MTAARAAAGLLLLGALVAGAILVVRARRPPASGPVEGAPSARPAGPRAPPARAEGARDAAATGEVVLVGLVLDQDGRAFAGLRVRADGPERGERSALTDEAGRFELVRLPRARVELVLTADFDPAQPLGERVLACALPPLELDLGAAPARLDVGTHIVPRSRPFWIEGLIELDEDWARAKGIGLADVRVELEAPRPEELPGLAPPVGPGLRAGAFDWSSPPWRAALPEPPRVEADGTFRFAVETPHDPFLLRVRLKRLEPFERLVQPTADGVFAETFRLPQ